MKKTIVLAAFLSLWTFANLSASNVDTVTVYSPSMNKYVKTVVVTPDSYDGVKSYPVLYLLHGYGGNYGTWVNSMPTTKTLADAHQFIIACPDGAHSSWYFDSPVDSAYRYETFVARELIDWMDKNHKTIASCEGRAITGLSMGGHGGLFLGFRHQDVFGACGSMSGGVDIRPFPGNWALIERLGKADLFPDNWEKHTVINQLYLLTTKKLQIIFDCGTEDFFYNVNLKLHDELTYRNIPHTFISRPGTHNRDYWDNAVKYQALFFSDFFNRR